VAWLCDEQRSLYESDGYLVVEDLLTGDEVDVFLEAQDKPADPDVKALRLRRHTGDGSWNAIASHPKIAGMVGELLDGPPQIVQTMFMAKQPDGGTGIALHQDTHYIRNEPNTLMACWVALSETDRDNGGLCVVPRSHKRPLYKTRPPSDNTQHASWTNEYAMRGSDGKEWVETMHSHEVDGLDPSEIVFLAVPRGGGVFFTSMTVHGSFANRSSDRKRFAFATHYVKEQTWVYRRDIQETVPAVAG
jgi:phytanoyl-CoA hydroxylase